MQALTPRKRRARQPSPQDAIMEAKGYMAVPALAKKIGKSIYTIYRWIQDGNIVGVQVLQRRYVLMSSVVTYLGQESAGLLGIDAEGGPPCSGA